MLSEDEAESQEGGRLRRQGQVNQSSTTWAAQLVLVGWSEKLKIHEDGNGRLLFFLLLRPVREVNDLTGERRFSISARRLHKV